MTGWLQYFGGRRSTNSRNDPASPPESQDRTTHNTGNARNTVQAFTPTRSSSISSDDSATLLEDFKTELNRAMPRIELDKVCRYLPKNSLLNIVTRRRLEQILPNADVDLIDFIVNNAKKLFIITINSIPPSDVTAMMREFKVHGLHDSRLPIDEINEICNAVPRRRGHDPPCGSAGESYCSSHEYDLDAFHHFPWTSTNRDHFCEYQWRLLVPDFTMKTFERFEPNRILSILKRDPKPVGGGHFSQVYRAELLADHQDHVPVQNDRITVAIKEMIHLTDPPDYNVETEWLREAEAMKEINKLEDEHITRGLAAFTQNKKYYLVFEWADGNLRDFWEENSESQLTESKVTEFIFQLKGLCDGLDKIHNSQKPSILRSRTGLSSPNLSGAEDGPIVPIIPLKYLAASPSVPTPRDTSFASPPLAIRPVPPTDSGTTLISAPSIDDSNWRHGDLKPDNILVFKKPAKWIGTLKLADLGRAKKHMHKTQFRALQQQNTEEKWSTRQYEPPEAYTASGEARSRLWDIWSMGCIMFESILWLLYGNKVKLSFETETTQRTPEETMYYTPGDTSAGRRTATVNKLTTDCIAHMIRHDPECQSDTAIGDMLVLIRDKLLVVDLPEVGKDESTCRATAKILMERMDIIYHDTKAKTTYTFKGADRANVKPPPQAPDNTTKIAVRHGATLAIPSDSGRLAVPVRTMKDTYTHAFRDAWEYPPDDTFAGRILKQQSTILQSLIPETPSRLCLSCCNHDFYSSQLKISAQVSTFRSRAQSCDLCKLLTQCVEGRGYPEAANLSFDRANSGLRLDGTGLPILSICRINEIPGLSPSNSAYIRMGLATLPPVGSPAQFRLMGSWLRDCNENHGDTCPSNAAFVLPSRLIDVGIDPPSPSVYIVEKEKLEALLNGEEDLRLKYTAFSHPWGKVEDKNKHFLANRGNIDKFTTDGILVEDLPQTFKDAVTISRGLGIQYLWIDSLCILQGPDGDFDQESKLMDAVFHSAYCVIAAASAVGTSSTVLSSRSAADTVVVPATRNGVQHSLYIRKSVDDFQADVLDAPLSKRGWVLQERALARRTIFFSNNQVYWECADGIRCETLTKLKNSKVAFLGDSNFPTYALKSTKGEDVSKGGQIFLYESLYAQYSTLNFTYAADRSVAILGLEQRLARAFNDHGEHGVFQRHLERGLMWRRGQDSEGRAIQKLTRILNTNDDGRGKKSPTWSWMAYEGGISFIAIEGRSLDWERGPKRLSWPIGVTDGNMRLKGIGKPFDLSVPNDTIIWDYGEKPQNALLKCVVLGRARGTEESIVDKKHYVLIIALTTVSDGGETLYERVGVGFLLGGCIHSEEEDVVIV
ncbi:hypothetical protein FKW77_004827 [Venturia effusa]|uniref:Protein kinase domain-containing protein n=1 Tax=Venturia effusa TaxID=50376 RepID=A0A517L796_9PEZI|nr:hypothetical protein FKW77_004827 [Venturia effusa]